MKTLRNSGDPRITELFTDRKFKQRVLLLGALLMVVALVAGCSMIEDFDNPTTTLAEATTTSDLAPTTTTSKAALTTTTTEVDETTTTTAAAETTTTSEVAESTTTTQADETSTTLAMVTTTTVPSMAQGPDESLSEGEVLYEISDWSDGVNGWAAAGQWKTTGAMLVTDGTSDSFAVAPVDMTGYPDYVVECEVQIVDPTDETLVLLMARMVNGTGYYGGFDGSQSRMVIGYDTTESAGIGFFLDDAWHTYRLEVRGNTLRLFMERAELLRVVDNHALEPGTVGIYCGNGQINVRSFRVIAL